MAKSHRKAQDKSSELRRNAIDRQVGLNEAASESPASKRKRGRAGRAAFDSEERYRLITERAADAMWTVDMNMRPTYISPSITPLLGYSVQQAMAKPMEKIFTPASFKLATRLWKEELGRDSRDHKDLARSRTLELELVHKDGSLVPVEVKYTFLRDAQARPVEVLAIARDISERRRAQEESKQNIEKLVRAMEHAIQAMTLVVEMRDPIPQATSSGQLSLPAL